MPRFHESEGNGGIMKKQIFAFAGTLVPVLLIAGCIAQNPSEHEPSMSHDEILERTKVEYIKITPQEARHMISRGGVIILDVRTRREYDEGHIKDAVLLPGNEIADNVKNVIADKNQTILVYCRSGARSARASRTLIDMGYEKIYDLGGIENWTGEIVRR